MWENLDFAGQRGRTFIFIVCFIAYAVLCFEVIKWINLYFAAVHFRYQYEDQCAQI